MKSSNENTWNSCSLTSFVVTSMCFVICFMSAVNSPGGLFGSLTLYASKRHTPTTVIQRSVYRYQYIKDVLRGPYIQLDMTLFLLITYKPLAFCSPWSLAMAMILSKCYCRPCPSKCPSERAFQSTRRPVQRSKSPNPAPLR